MKNKQGQLNERQKKKILLTGEKNYCSVTKYWPKSTGFSFPQQKRL